MEFKKYYFIFLSIIFYSCSSEELSSPERGQKSTAAAAATATNPNADSVLSQNNELDATSSSKAIKTDENNPYDNDNTTAPKVVENIDTKQEVKGELIIYPVYKLHDEETESTFFDYGLVKGKNDSVAFVVFAENKLDGLQPLYRCRINNTFRMMLSNESDCGGHEVKERLGYVYKDHNGEKRDYLIRCYNSKVGGHSVILGKDIVTDGVCSPGYAPEGPLGGTPQYQIKENSDGTKSYVVAE